MFTYEFEKAGIVQAETIREALNKVFKDRDIKLEYPKDGYDVVFDIIAVSGNKRIDSLVKVKAGHYARPEPYSPPEKGKEGEGDWMYDEIMRFRSDYKALINPQPVVIWGKRWSPAYIPERYNSELE
jgi:hypothetical protein